MVIVNKKDLLIIDDDIFLAKNMAAFLSTHGYRVDYKTSGIEALDAYREFTPSVVILDIVMPGMNGMEVLAAMVRMNANSQIIMVSGKDDQETIEQAMKAGAYDFIGKPVQLEMLIRRVHLAYLEYMSKVLGIDVQAEITKHFAELNILTDPTKRFDHENLELYLKKVDIEINRELALIISHLNSKFRIDG